MELKDLMGGFYKKYELLEADESDNPSRATIQSRRSYFPFVISTGLCLSFILNAALLFRLWNTPSLELVCTRHLENTDSPILDSIPIKYETVWFNGSFFKPTQYVAPASPEVDALWEDLGTELLPFTVPVEQAERYGLDRRQSKRASEKGGGVIVMLEGQHHVHCLVRCIPIYSSRPLANILNQNVLRQTSYYDYEYYRQRGQGVFLNDENIVRNHWAHCLDILRQQLMCMPDTGVYGEWFVKDVGQWLDFNTPHKCRNYQDMIDYIRVRQMDVGEVPRLMPGDVVLDEIP